jgi:hypothetical protein
MPDPNLRRPLVAFGAAASVVAVVSIKHLGAGETAAGSDWQCSDAWYIGALHVLNWLLFSELGQAVALFMLTAVALLRILYTHPWRDARECATVMTLLLTIMLCAAPYIDAEIRTQECNHAKQTPNKATPAPGEGAAPALAKRRPKAIRS